MKHGVVIRTGDVIKLGTTLLLIKESSIDIQKIKKREKEGVRESKDLFSKPLQKVCSLNLGESVKKDIKSSIECEICTRDHDTKENPMINPCGCVSPIRNIHYKCLIKKIDEKLENRKISNFYESFIYKDSKCETCQQLYPESIRKNGTVYNLFNF